MRRQKDVGARAERLRRETCWLKPWDRFSTERFSWKVSWFSTKTASVASRQALVPEGSTEMGQIYHESVLFQRWPLSFCFPMTSVWTRRVRSPWCWCSMRHSCHSTNVEETAVAAFDPDISSTLGFFFVLLGALVLVSISKYWLCHWDQFVYKCVQKNCK